MLDNGEARRHMFTQDAVSKYGRAFGNNKLSKNVLKIE